MIVCLVSALVATGQDTGVAAPSKPSKPPAPKVTRVAPGQGAATGGTKVTIKGQHLGTARRVTFGGVKGTRLTVKNDHKLTVTAPAHAAGTVDVRVKTRGGTSPTSKGVRFTYTAAPPAPRLRRRACRPPSPPSPRAAAPRPAAPA